MTRVNSSMQVYKFRYCSFTSQKHNLFTAQYSYLSASPAWTECCYRAGRTGSGCSWWSCYVWPSKVKVHQHWEPFTVSNHVHSTVTAAQTVVPCKQRGEINIIGIETEYLIAGRLDICDSTIRRAVHHWSWDLNESQLVYTERGFPAEGKHHRNMTCTVNY